MVKIEYDLNNAKHCEMVDDYYFLKYFIKCLKNDWYKKFLDVYMHAFNEGHCAETDFDDFQQLVMKHTNKYELNFALEILFKNEIINRKRGKDDYEYINDLLWFHYQILREYKQLLIDRFHKT